MFHQFVPSFCVRTALMSGNLRTVCVVGGGIGGLVCAQSLLHMTKSAGINTRIVLLEKSPRLGGQIRTRHILVNGSSVIIEEGAEGFVTRSEVFPRVASYAGMPSESIVDQIRIADNELSYDIGSDKWFVKALPPGLAAQKLGFQVPDRDRGRGIRSFRYGMGQFVRQIESNLPEVRMKSEVRSISVSDSPTAFKVGFCLDETSSESELIADAVVLGVPMHTLHNILKYPGLPEPPPPPGHNSHISVHLLVSRTHAATEPASFTVPNDLQQRFGGLRAVALVNEKFPNRCPDDSWLFRFYYRPTHNHDPSHADHWIGQATRTLDEIFGIRNPTASWFSPWLSILPIINRDHLEACRLWKDEVQRSTSGRVVVVGSEVAGAGLEAAAISGFDAASSIFARLTV